MKKKYCFRIGCNVFIISTNMLLLGKRKEVFGHGTWALPGGHLKKWEKLVDCAKREIKEELGIKNAKLEFGAVADDMGKKEHYIQFGFVLDNFRGKIRLMEPEICYEWRFFPLSRLPKNIFKPHQKLIRTFLNKKNYLN